ncbi:MAG TPA: hypothetical protein VIX59_13260 [Candidatus Binataceae bacterium]
MNCWHCGCEIEVNERVGFHELCPRCDRAAHVCLNCGLYDGAYNNQCRETMAERVVDKDRANFCEYFTPAHSGHAHRAAAQITIESARKPPAKTQLDALFKKKDA